MTTERHSLNSWMNWRRRLWALALGAMIPFAGVAGFLLGHRQDLAEGASLPIQGTAPAYTMTNQLGERVASSSLQGKVQLVTFLFPYCTTMCPLIAAHLTNLENLGIRPAGLENKIEIVSFNLDPTGTGPPQMRAFLKQYGWNPRDPHWQYLTGSPQQISQVVRNGFGVWYKKVSLASEVKNTVGVSVVQPEVANKLAMDAHVNYDIVHNDVLEVVDQKGRIRKIYDDADTVDWTNLLSVIQSLVKERT